MNRNQRNNLTRQILVVGIGSPHGDDQIGWDVVRELATIFGDQIVARTLQAPVELIDWLDDCQELIVCDACRSKSDLGTLHRWEWPTDALETHERGGSHELSLPYVLTLAEKLGKLPKQVTVWGIELGDTSSGDSITESIALTIPQIARTIADEIVRNLSTIEPCYHA